MRAIGAGLCRIRPRRFSIDFGRDRRRRRDDTVEGGFASFNVIETHQSDLRRRQYAD